MIGSAQGRRAIAASIARAARCRVLVPDYRLAPEHKFPAAVDDALAVYQWTSNRIGPDRLILGGDSAGAGLVLATLLALRDQRLPRPAGGVAMSPLADWTLSSESHRTLRERDPFVTAEMLTRLRPDYLGGHDPRDPLASPVFGDYADLPPLLVLVGTEETLLDDAFGVARAAARGGGAVDLRVFQSMFHIWPMFASILPEGNDAIGLVADFVTKHVS